MSVGVGQTLLAPPPPRTITALKSSLYSPEMPATQLFIFTAGWRAEFPRGSSRSAGVRPSSPPRPYQALLQRRSVRKYFTFISNWNVSVWLGDEARVADDIIMAQWWTNVFASGPASSHHYCDVCCWLVSHHHPSIPSIPLVLTSGYLYRDIAMIVQKVT